MKRLLLIGYAVIALTFLAAPASAEPGHAGRAPTVHRGIAYEQTIKMLAEYSSWPYRIYGEVDCDGGRWNRTIWRCKVFWLTRSACWKGRSFVEGGWFNPNEGNTPWFTTHVHTHRIC